MAAPERFRRGACWILAFAGAALVVSCKSVTDAPPDATPLPPQTLVAPRSQAPPAPDTPPDPPQTPPESPQPSPPANPAPAKPQTIIVIESAESADPEVSQDLAAAARRERERRRQAQVPVAVINQKNLAEWAEGGVLTQTNEPEPPSEAEVAAAEVVEKAAVEEAYWRRRGREIRQRWRDAVDQIALLEAKSNDLRNRFYATDDGYLRDSQIKPEWDKAIADLEEARYRASRGSEEVLTFLAEGRRAGALPGWLREGSELEPEPVVEATPEGPTALEAAEPVIYRDPAESESEESQEEPPGASPRPSR